MIGKCQSCVIENSRSTGLLAGNAFQGTAAGIIIGVFHHSLISLRSFDCVEVTQQAKVITISWGNCIENVYWKSEASLVGDKHFDDGLCVCAYLGGVFRYTCYRLFGHSEICLHILLYNYAVGQHCDHPFVWPVDNKGINKKILDFW